MESPRTFSKHFSHEHPLQHISPPPRRQNRSRVCAACRITIMPHSDYYHCKLCNFSLHKVCYTMPKKVVHPADPNHHLNLTVTAPSVTDQSNECKACGKGVTGFYYSCAKCCLRYHMLCVALPLSVKIPSSHPHLLKLELQPPYDFRCDLLCHSDKPSYDGWLYRCRDCEFDAHVSCAVKGTQSLHQKSVSSLEHEVMELLSEAMKGTSVNSESNLEHDQSIPVSEDFTYQFSDVCFSIDISNSILFEENRNKRNGKLEAVKTQSFEHGGKDLKRESSLAPMITGIGSHVWEELGSGDKGKIVNSTSYRMQMKDQNNEVESRRSFWSKFLVCS